MEGRKDARTEGRKDTIAWYDMRVHARSGFQKKIKHKTDHNSGSRFPFDIKSSAFDNVFHAEVTGDSFEG